ncbi:hypothetical protein M758_UG250600 [Ceratodon purpureus]|nr:hypothetical protein M758_UG250600 [Ceratodon purpureus]
MQMIGDNIRERRVRLRRAFAKADHKNSVHVAGGVTLDSWNAMFDSLSNPKYQTKSDKCKVAADERTRKKGFTHKLGSKGVQGLVRIFVDKFDRPPTEKEVVFAKQNGIQAAVDKVRNGSLGCPIQKAVDVGKEFSKSLKKKGKKIKQESSLEDEESFEDTSSNSSYEEVEISSSDSDDGSETDETGSDAEDSFGAESNFGSDEGSVAPLQGIGSGMDTDDEEDAV